MEPAVLHETRHYSGDRWIDGHRVFGPVTFDGLAPALPCLYCRVQFRNNADVLGFELNSEPQDGQGAITIVDHAAYIFAIPEQALPLAPGVWAWYFATYRTSNHSDQPMTFWRGSVVITKRVSHD